MFIVIPIIFCYPLLFPLDPFFSTSPPVVTMFKMPLGPAATMTHEKLLRKGWSIMSISSMQDEMLRGQFTWLGPIPSPFHQSYFLSLAHLFRSHLLHREIIFLLCVLRTCLWRWSVYSDTDSLSPTVSPPFQKIKSLILPNMLFISSISCSP